MNLMPLPRMLAVSVLVLASGCAATSTGLGKRNLEVQTKMTDTIFLEPVSPHDRTVLVQVRNTSDRAEFDIAARGRGLDRRARLSDRRPAGGGALPAPGERAAGRAGIADRRRADLRGRLRRHPDRRRRGRRRRPDRQRRHPRADRRRPGRGRHLERRRRADRGRDLHHRHRCPDLRARRRRRGGHRAARAEPAPGHAARASSRRPRPTTGSATRRGS